MSQYDFEKTLFSYIDNVRQQQSVRPLSLGGVAGSSGGSGGPTGGAIGQLTQSRVTFDTTEAETWGFVTVSGVPSGTSLVTNLNRIRYRLKSLESSLVSDAGLLSITVSASAPGSPDVGDLWVDIS